MDPIARWLFERYRGRYFALILVLSVLLSAGTIMAPVGATVVLWFDLGMREAAVFAAVNSLTLVFGVAVVAATMWDGTIAPIRRWLDGDTADPAAVWEAVHRVPRQATIRAGAITVLVAAAGIVPLLVSWTDAPSEAWVIFAVAVVLTGMSVLGFVIIGLALLLGPVAAEIAEVLPAEAAPSGTALRVRTRIVIGAAICAQTAAWITAGAATSAETDLSQLTVAISAGVLVAGYSALLFSVGIASSVSAPLGDLIEATERVAQGDYTRRTPITTTDEIGQLSLAFNRMQEGLLERQRLSTAFGSYVDPALAARLLENGDAQFEGELVEATVLFVDVRDFTSFAERSGAQATVARLNELFELIVPVLHDRQGHANQFLGDGKLEFHTDRRHRQRREPCGGAHQADGRHDPADGEHRRCAHRSASAARATRRTPLAGHLGPSHALRRRVSRRGAGRVGRARRGPEHRARRVHR